MPRNIQTDYWENGVTPLSAENLNAIENELVRVRDATTGQGGGATQPLPTKADDGKIYYVVTVNVDMIYTDLNTITNPPLDSKYFKATNDGPVSGARKWHLEIWWNHNGWHKFCDCGYDRLYTCVNTGKLYYMVNGDGTGYIPTSHNSGYVENGTTNEAQYFMRESAQASHVIFKGSLSGHSISPGGQIQGGIPLDWIYRDKLIVLSFDIQDGERNYPAGSDTHPLLSVAFDPRWLHGGDEHGNNGDVFVPFVNVYDVDPTGTHGLPEGVVGGMTFGALRCVQKPGILYIYGFVPHSFTEGTYGEFKPVWIRTIVGVPDASVGWDNAEHS